MSEEIELKLLDEIKELKNEIKKLKGELAEKSTTYNYSKITFTELENLVEIEQNYNNTHIFDEWFYFEYQLNEIETTFLLSLIEKNSQLIENYNEEDLKIHFIAPILNFINFVSIQHKIRDFYETTLTYNHKNFVFSGSVDYIIAKGLHKAKIPYFFIQEFKKSIKNDDPRPQLLAELISAIELNNFKSIKGAYIIGSIWNFVILEKLSTDRYQYYISENFDSTKIKDLEQIYKNLLYIKKIYFI